MRSSSNKPFAFIHVPKCAGTSLRSVFYDWYGSGVISHYYHEPSGGAPKPLSLEQAQEHASKHGVCCIFGHFNSQRGFGVRHNIPFVRSYLTILREPFSQFVSEFKYKAVRARTNLDFYTYLQENKPNYLNHFPNNVTFENYQEEIDKFDFVGMYENFDESVAHLAKMLGKQPPRKTMTKQNVGPPDSTDYSIYKAEFVELNKLECIAYDYAKNLFEDKVL